MDRLKNMKLSLFHISAIGNSILSIIAFSSFVVITN